MGKTALTFLSHSLNATAYRHLVLLATTSVALSIASGWTTWDGMENFTDNPVLSFLITFGIQGVMLVAAWLIGETLVRDSRTAAVRTAGSARRRGNILRHVPLWSMFLVCFTASVFFSFDSLFDRIFPPEERERAGLSRAQGDVAGLLNGLLARVEAHRSEVAAALFSGEQWAEYDRQLAGMVSAASNLTASVRSRQEEDARDRHDEIESRRLALAEAEARLTAVETETERTRRAVLAAEAVEDDARAQVEVRERELVDRQRDLRVKAAEAEAERAGVGVTGKSGEGPKFREIKRAETALQIETSLSERLLTDARERLAQATEARKSLEAEAATLESRSTALSADVGVAQRQLAALGSGSKEDAAVLQQIAEQVDRLTAAKAAFLSEPEQQRLQTLQSGCEALSATLRAHADDASCRADLLTEPVGAVLAANAASAFFQERCGRAARLDGLGTDGLLAFGRECLKASGLQNAAAADFQRDLRRASFSRDDQAHRFIVTWNAFLDGNQLALVALFIAVSIDGLIFMAGLFGARASADGTAQLERAMSGTDRNRAIALDAALLPDARRRARAVLEAISFPGGKGGSAGRIDLKQIDSDQIAAVRAVLNAATVTGMARPTDKDGCFTVRPALVEHLSHRLGCAQGLGSGPLAEVDPERLLRLSLAQSGPDVVRMLLRSARPLAPGGAFGHDIAVDNLPEPVREQAVGILNAGVACACVSADPDVPNRYLLSQTFFPTLADVAHTGHEPASDARDPDLIGDSFERAPALPASSPTGDTGTPAGEVRPARPPNGDANRTPRPAPLFQRQRQPEATVPPQANGVEPRIRLGNGGGAGSDPQPELAPRKTGQAASAHATPPRADQMVEPPSIALAPSITVVVTSQPTEESDSDESRTLVAFPPANLAQTTDQGGPSQAAPSVEAAPAEGILERVGRAVGLQEPALEELLDPMNRQRHEAACAAVRALRTADGGLDRLLRRAESAVRSEMDELIRPDDSGRTDADARAERLITENEPLIVLHARGLREVRQWCDALVLQRELMAETGALSAEDARSLAGIAHALSTLKTADRLSGTDWDTLIRRIDRLRRSPVGATALSEIMP